MKKEVVFYSKPVRFMANCESIQKIQSAECPVIQACQAKDLPILKKDADSRVVINIENTSIEQMAAIRQLCLKCQKTK